MKKLILILLTVTSLVAQNINVQKNGSNALTGSFVVPSGVSISATGTGQIIATNVPASTVGNSILAGNGSGGFQNVTIGTGLSFTGNTLSSSGTVSSFSFVNGNGITGTVTNPTSTPALSLSLGAITPTTINGNTISTGTGTLNLGSYTITLAQSGTLGSAAYTASTSYDPAGAAAAVSANSLQKANNLSDLASASTARTNLGLGTVATQTAPSGTSSQLLANNGTGGFSNVTVGSGLSFSGGTLSSTAGGGSVTSVGTSGSVNGITLTGGPITGSGTVTLGGTLSNVNLTSQVTGTLPVANGGTGVITSTGSGNVVLSNSPTLVTPALGTPSSVTLTNGTGLPLTTGVTGTLPIANGGTNATTATTARANILPSYTGQAGNLLAVNGTATDTVWVTPNSASGSTGYWASLYDTSNQTAANTTTAYALNIASNAGASGITVNSSNQITFAYTGTYQLTYSIQFQNTDTGSGNDNVDIWIRKNGTDVTASNSIFNVPLQKGSTPGSLIAVTPYVLQLNAGDYIQIMWAVSNTTVSVVTTAAQTGPTIPQTPGVLVAVQQVANIQTNGTVTNVSAVGQNGIGIVTTNPTTTPVITLNLGAITPTSVSTGALTATGTTTLATSLTGSLQASNGVVSAISNTGSGNNVLATSPSLTSPTIGSGITFSGSTSGTTILQPTAVASGTLTLPATTDTLVGKATTDIFTNKSISGATNTLTAIPNSALTNSSITIAGTSTSLGGSITQDTITGLSTTGLVKRTGANTLAIATSGTDYAPATSGSSILYGNAAGGFSNVTIGTGVSFSGGTLSATGLGGTVTTFSSGSLSPLFNTSVATATTTPALSFTLSNAAANTIFGNNTSLSAAPAYNTVSSYLDNAFSSTQGAILYRGATSWAALPTGTAGQLLQSGGAAANPSWTTYTGSSSITTVGTLTSGAIGTGFTAIPNSALANSSITFGSTSQALGSTVSALNGVSIGASTASTGAFTSLTATGTTTLATSLSGLLKATSGVVSTATSGTDYAPATSGTSLLYGNGTGGFSNATIGSSLSFSGGTLNTAQGLTTSSTPQFANLGVGLAATSTTGLGVLYTSTGSSNYAAQIASLWNPSANGQTFTNTYLQSGIGGSTYTGLTYYNLYLGTGSSTGNLATAYQLYIGASPSTATTKYGIYQASSTDSNYFAGSISAPSLTLSTTPLAVSSGGTGSTTAAAGQRGLTPATSTVTSGASPAINWSLSNSFDLTLTSATAATISFSNAQDGQTITITIHQPASGTATTVTWPSSSTLKWAGGTAPTMTATLGKTDIYTIYYNATAGVYYGSYVQNF